jgi:predicted  nucleic acid-binding Zn-ribbon protein
MTGNQEAVDRIALPQLQGEVQRLRDRVGELEHELVRVERRLAETETELEMALIRRHARTD